MGDAAHGEVAGDEPCAGGRDVDGGRPERHGGVVVDVEEVAAALAMLFSRMTSECTISTLGLDALRRDQSEK
jgi:hypothetical protein